MALRSLGLLFLSTLVSAQNSTKLGNITTVNVPAGSTIKAGDFITFNFVFEEGAVGQVLRNVTAELMVGAVEDNGSNVADVMSIHGNDLGAAFDNDISYWLSAATPPGNYHIRVNGTIYDTLNATTDKDPGTALGAVTARSKTWILSHPDPFLCTIPSFTPVPSVTDPNFSPLQLGQPPAGFMYYLNNISQVGSIAVAPSWVDESFGGGTSINQMTMEVVKSGTLESVGSVVLNSTQQAFQALPVDKFQLVAGAFRIRANFTDKNHAGNFVTLSDEFYIASQGPCVGLQSGNSTTSGGGSGSSGNPSQTPKGAALSGSTIPVTGLFVLFLSLLAGAATVLA
ncbi:hypothetical protein MVEN_00895500 [Mycena venus]|uniref:Uncharacterized protein n=1 Tax=Mycena venus TaxID=2733690 RepID=A0A8H7D1W2_9AGAR|nr:hypothetical protein MVEN_00895500 [Mycena venus]